MLVIGHSSWGRRGVAAGRGGSRPSGTSSWTRLNRRPGRTHPCAMIVAKSTQLLVVIIQCTKLL